MQQKLSPEALLAQSVDSLEDAENKDERGSSSSGIFLLLINTTIGSGTLLIPYCYKIGVALVLIVSLCLTLVALWSLYMLIDSARVTGTSDYQSLFRYTFGDKYGWIMNSWIAVVLFGTIIIYVLWIGRLMKHLLPFDKGLLEKEAFWNVAVSVILIFPLTCLKSLKMLESWSGLALFFIVWLLAHAIYWFVRGVIEEGFKSDEIVYFKFSRQVISTFGVWAMAFDCHCNIFQALALLKNPTKERTRRIIGTVVGSSFVLYNAFGLFTYLHLFDALGPGAALEYYPITNWFTKLTIIGVIIILVLGAPMMVWPTRNSIIDLFNLNRDSTLTWIGVGGALVSLATLFACISNDIVFFFDLVGGLLTPGFVFTLPAVFYLKNVPNLTFWDYIMAAIVIVASVGAVIACTYQVLRGSD